MPAATNAAPAAATPAQVDATLPASNPHNPAMCDLRFGIEIESYHPTAGSRLQVAQRIAQIMGAGWTATTGGTDRYGRSRALVVMPDGRRWTVDSDGSINAHGGVDAEVVSPILTWADMPALQAMIRAMRQAGCKADSSCGIHVHVDGARFKADPRKLVNLIKLVDKREAQIHDMLGGVRRGSQWCRNINRTFVDRVTSGRFTTETALRNAWFNANPGYGGTNEDRARRHGDSSRYHGLNLHSLFHLGTVEFRYFDAANLHAGKIRSYVCLVLALAGKAIASKSVRDGNAAYRTGVEGARNMLYHELGLRADYFANVRAHLMAPVEAAAGRPARAVAA